MKLSEYIFENYKEYEPIFSTEICIAGVSNGNLRQQFRDLYNKGIINRFDDGIYYIPKKTKLKGGAKLPSEYVAKYKYISRNDVVFGYISGFSFANQIGILNQVPVKEEIVSNNMTAAIREVRLGNQIYIVRKPKTIVTAENQKVLQLLDLLKDIDMYCEVDMALVRTQISEYMIKNSITRESFEKYINLYPIKTYKTIFDLRLEDVFARR